MVRIVLQMLIRSTSKILLRIILVKRGSILQSNGVKIMVCTILKCDPKSQSRDLKNSKFILGHKIPIISLDIF